MMEKLSIFARAPPHILERSVRITMIDNRLAILLGTLTLLHFATGKLSGFPAAFSPQFHRSQGSSPTSNRHHNLRQQRRVQTNAKSPPIFNCDTNPLVKQETGCPCFTAKTITALMDVEADAESCDFSATQPSDPYSQLSPRSSSFFATAAYANAGTVNINFGVSYYDPSMQGGGSCNGSVFFAKYDYDETGMTSDSAGESHNYDISLRVTKKQFNNCLKVLNKVKASLPSGTCTINAIGGDY
jgi:hypothetical protein